MTLHNPGGHLQDGRGRPAKGTNLNLKNCECGGLLLPKMIEKNGFVTKEYVCNKCSS